MVMVKDNVGQANAVNRGFEDLKVWQLARTLMRECHKQAERFPAWERYDLVDQLRRASKSVMANIAEGYGRYHYLDSLRFYYIARGSLNETINHLITAHDLAYLDDPTFASLYDLSRDAERVLNGFITYIWKQQQGQAHYGQSLIAEDTAVYEINRNAAFLADFADT